jgi:feruloyl esterase
MDAPYYLAGPYGSGSYDFIPDNAVDNNVHDSFLSLMNWVENRTTPECMVVTSFYDNENPVGLKA